MTIGLKDMAAAIWRMAEIARALARGEGVTRAQAEQCGRDGVALERGARTLDYIVEKGVDQFRAFLLLPDDLRAWIATEGEDGLREVRRIALEHAGSAKPEAGGDGARQEESIALQQASEAKPESGAGGATQGPGGPDPPAPQA
jgi:hypothetical protein